MEGQNFVQYFLHIFQRYFNVRYFIFEFYLIKLKLNIYGSFFLSDLIKAVITYNVIWCLIKHFRVHTLENKQEMSQTRDECPQRNWSSIRYI